MCIMQDKYLQKLHFSKSGIPLPEFREVCIISWWISHSTFLEAPFVVSFQIMLKYIHFRYIILKVLRGLESCMVIHWWSKAKGLPMMGVAMLLLSLTKIFLQQSLVCSVSSSGLLNFYLTLWLFMKSRH